MGESDSRLLLDPLIMRQLTARSLRIREPTASQTMPFAIVILMDKGTSGLVSQTFPMCSSHHRWLFDLCDFRKRTSRQWAFQELTFPCSEPTAQRPSSRGITRMQGDPVSLRLQRKGCSAEVTLPPTEAQPMRCGETQPPSQAPRFHSSNRSTREKKNNKEKERKAHTAQGEARMP